jgi:hypothetical protein
MIEVSSSRLGKAVLFWAWLAACGGEGRNFVDDGAGGGGGTEAGGVGGSHADAGAGTGDQGGSGGRAGAGSGGTGDAGSAGEAGTGDGGEAGTGDCRDGVVRCDLGAPEECRRGQWEAGDPCPGEAPYCYEGQCLPCAPDTYSCAGATLERCDATGVWQTAMSCTGSTPICNAQTGACVGTRLVGSFAQMSGSSSTVLWSGEFLLLQRSCAANACVLGGFSP